MKHIFIINSTNANRSALKIIENIQKVCKNKSLSFEICYTKAPGDTTKIAREYINEENVIYGVGGDGTVLEVLNGIVGTKNMLGIIPTGSGNDFYKTIKERKEEILKSDIGKINDLYFINVACLGIDAEVANNVPIMKKKRIPKDQLYNASIIYTFIKFKFKDIKFRFNNEEKNGKYTILSVCNGKYYGGGYKIAPDSSINDGLFDIYYADEMSKISIPRLILKLKKGKHEEDKKIHKQQSSNIVIETQEPVRFNVDGEILENTRFNIELIKDGITIYNNKELVEEILKI